MTEILYTCPMHPEVHQNTPGSCPECGMNLVPVKNKTGYLDDRRVGHKTSSFLTKFWVVLVLTIPIFFYSEMALMVFHIQAPRFSGSEYILLILGSIVFFYGGWVFIASARRELSARLPGMMTLIAIAISAAYLYSFFSILFGTGHDLLFELSSLIAVMLLGHWIEMKSVQGAAGALKELAKLLPDTAEVIRGRVTKVIPLSELIVGDTVLVKPGAKVPADGEIIDGQSELNESILTGESKPVSKTPGGEVIAGAINGDGSLKIKITKIGKETFLAGVMRLVQEAEASKSRLQILSDRAAFYLTIIAITAGWLTMTAWLIAEAGFGFAIERLVAVLVIACPHALGLAVPLVASISTTLAARQGFLIKQRLALEAARSINIVLFDKTGTLTKGEFGVDKIISAVSGDETKVLQYAAAINSHSEHPLAKATAEEAKKKNIQLYEIKNFQRIPGKGIRAEIAGSEITVGSTALAEERGAPLAGTLKTETDILAKQGKTINIVLKDGMVLGAISFVDIIREESREAIQTLKEMGIKTAMITGDAEDVAKWVAGELRIDEYFARVLPNQKSEKVKLLQSKRLKVAMVGDGVNDAPALTQADLGVAIGAGTNVAIESAGIILVRNDPRDIPKIIHLSRLTYRKMIQNLWWATGYNIIAIPLAAGVLASKGILLQPALAAVFMSVSTVIVALNAVLLRRQKI